MSYSNVSFLACGVELWLSEPKWAQRLGAGGRWFGSISESELMVENAAGAPFAMVVDDNHLILTAALEILENAGFQTLMALHADDAMAGLQAHAGAVTLLFTDVEMPGSSMDGFALARAASATWPEIGILVASGAVSPLDGDLPPGAIFVAKPFSPEVIYERVHQLLPDGKKPDLLVRRMS